MYRKAFLIAASAVAIVAASATAPALAAPNSLSEANAFAPAHTTQASKTPIQQRRYAQNSTGGCKDDTGNQVPCKGGGTPGEEGSVNNGLIVGLVAVGFVAVAVGVSSNSKTTHHGTLSAP